MKPETFTQNKSLKPSGKPYIPVALGEMGRSIRSAMPRVTAAEANAQADRVRAITDKRRVEMMAARGDRPPEKHFGNGVKDEPFFSKVTRLSFIHPTGIAGRFRVYATVSLALPLSRFFWRPSKKSWWNVDRTGEE